MSKKPLELNSAMIRWIEELPQKKAQGIQYLGALKKKGATPDELEWSGLTDWLEDNNDVITRSQLHDFVVNNGLQVFEQTNELFDGTTAYESISLPGGTHYRELLFTLPERMPSRYMIEDLKYLGPGHYDEDAHDMFWPVDAGDQVFLIPKSKAASADAALQYVVDTKTINFHDDVNFQSSHFGVNNLLAHLRVNTFNTDGKKTLLVEEIQSDWHQQGRRFGYNYIGNGKLSPREAELQGLREAILSDTPITDDLISRSDKLEAEVGSSLSFKTKSNNVMSVPDAPFKNNRWLKMVLKRVVKMAVDEGYDSISWVPGSVQMERSSSNRTVDKIRATYTIQKDRQPIWNLFGGSSIGVYELIGSEMSAIDIKNKIGGDLFTRISDETKGKAPGEAGIVNLDNIKVKIENRGVAEFYDSIVPKTLKSITKGLDPEAAFTTSALRSKTEIGTVYDANALQHIRKYILFTSDNDLTADGSDKKQLKEKVQSVLDGIISNFKGDNSKITSGALNDIFAAMSLPTIEELGFSIYGGDPIYNDAVIQVESLEVTPAMRAKAADRLTLFQFAGPQSATSDQFTLAEAKRRLDILDKCISDILKLEVNSSLPGVLPNGNREHAVEFFDNVRARFDAISIAEAGADNGQYSALVDNEILFSANTVEDVEAFLTNERLILDAAVRSGIENAPEAIRQSTGWFIGMDNQWRYEISDQDAAFKPIQNLLSFSDFEDRYNALPLHDKSRVDEYAGSNTLTPPQQASKDALWLELGLPSENSVKTYSLGDLITHDKLFAAYPDLANITVVLRQTENQFQLSGSLENYRSGAMVLRVEGNLNDSSQEEIIALIGHEIQHAIQQIEGYARGGSVDNFEETQEYKDISQELQLYSVATTALNRIEYIGESVIDASRYLAKQYDDIGPGQLVRILNKESHEEIRARYSELSAMKKNLSPYTSYQSLHGEVEARLTQSDFRLTDDERSARNPSKSYDTPSDRIMVRFDTGTMSCEAMSNIRPINSPENRAAVKFHTDNFASIFLGQDSDPSSVIHEGAHVYLEMYNDIANLPTASAAIKDDFAVILNWFGVTKNQWDHLPVEARIQLHEQFAETFEQYMSEGLAPTPQMSSEFQKFEGWMGEVYGNVKTALPNAMLNDDIRAVFDRMLTSANPNSLLAIKVGQQAELQLIEAGITPEVAKAQAAILKASYSSFAEKAGISPERFLERYDFSIGFTNTVPVNKKEALNTRIVQTPEFRGNNPGEAIEWYFAKNNGLDLSYERRKQRAEEQGYSTDRICYFDKDIGSNGLIDKASAAETEYIFSTSARVANEARLDRNDTSPAIKPNPSFLMMGKSLIVDNDFLDRVSISRFPGNGYTSATFCKEYQDQIRAWVAEGGYDSVIVRDDSRINLEGLPEEARIIFSPESVKSIHSAFDSAPSHAHLMAAQSFAATYANKDPDLGVGPHIDTRTVWHHGTPHKTDFDSFKASSGGELGKGVYVTQNLKLARNYAQPRGDIEIYEEAIAKSGVIDLYGPKLKNMTKAEFLADRKKYYDAEMKANGGEWDMSCATRAEAKQRQTMINDGHGGINMIDEDQAVIFDPNDIVRLDALEKTRTVDNSFNESPSRASDRLGRAHEMGYDTIVYHASGRDIEAFKPSFHRGATFFSTTPDGAVKGAKAGMRDGTGSGSDTIYQVIIPAQEILGLNFTPAEQKALGQFTEPYLESEVDQILSELPGRSWHELFTEHSEDGTHFYYHAKEPISLSQAAETGKDIYGKKIHAYGGKGDFHSIDGKRVNGEQFRAINAKSAGMSGYLQLDEAGLTVAMVKPERIRSVNADFDPGQFESNNILAQNNVALSHDSGPWYHSSNEIFETFRETADIGFHFGTIDAALDRASDKPAPEVTVSFVEPSHMALESLKVFNGYSGDSTRDQLYSLLLSKLGNPTPDLNSIVEQMDINEVAEVYNEYSDQPDAPEFIERVNNAQKGSRYEVEIDNKVFASVKSPEEALAIKNDLEEQQSSPFKVMLSSNNPYSMNDLGTWSPEIIARNANLTEAETAHFHTLETHQDQYQFIIDSLKARGFDSISYVNEVESPGSESIIVFDPEQISILSRGGYDFGTQNGVTLNQSAFHGSPHNFGSFNLDFMSSGEGQQAFGWGMYFSERKSICEWYRDKLSIAQGVEVSGKTICLTAIGTLDKVLDAQGNHIPTEEIPESYIVAAESFFVAMKHDQGQWKERACAWAETLVDDYSEEAASEAVRLIRAGEVSMASNRYLYSVDIPENYELLNYNGTIQEQSPVVKAAIMGAMARIREQYEPQKQAASDDYNARYHARTDIKLTSFSTGEVVAENLTAIEAEKRCDQDHDLGIIDDTHYQPPKDEELFCAFEEFCRHGIDGGEFYIALSNALGGDKEASLFLDGIDIPGLRFQAGTIANIDIDASNYTIWNESVVGLRSVTTEEMDFDTSTEVTLNQASAQAQPVESTFKGTHEDFLKTFSLTIDTVSDDNLPEIIYEAADLLEGRSKDFYQWLRRERPELHNRNTKEILGEVSQFYPDTEFSSWAERYSLSFAREQTAQKIISGTPDLLGLELTNGDGRYGLILPDASEPGRYRVSYYDKHSFSHHETVDAPEDAVRLAVNNGLKHIPEEPMLPKLSQTKDWAWGVECARLRLKNILPSAAYKADWDQEYDAAKTKSGLTLNQKAYHGTPHEFTEFSLGHVGKGEGNQAFGWGVYFASQRDIATFYRHNISKAHSTFDGLRAYVIQDQLTKECLDYCTEYGSTGEAIKVLERKINTQSKFGNNAYLSKVCDFIKENESLFDIKPAHIYEVDIPENNALLNYEDALSDQPNEVFENIVANRSNLNDLLPERYQILSQDDFSITDDYHLVNEYKDAPARLREKLIAKDGGPIYAVKVRTPGGLVSIRGKGTPVSAKDTAEAWVSGKINDSMSITGGELYDLMAKGEHSVARPEDFKDASAKMLESGIPGLSYLDGDSRAGTGNTRNFVVWDENQLVIKNSTITAELIANAPNVTPGPATFNQSYAKTMSSPPYMTMSEEAIDELIADSFEHEEDYDGNSFTSRYVVRMPIDDFLHLTLVDELPPEQLMKEGPSISRIGQPLSKAFDPNEVDSNHWEDYPYLQVRNDWDDTAKVCNHEGRHRAALLKQEGAFTIPVVIEVTNHDETLDQLGPDTALDSFDRFIGQFDESRSTPAPEGILAVEENIDQINALIGDDSVPDHIISANLKPQMVAQGPAIAKTQENYGVDARAHIQFGTDKFAKIMLGPNADDSSIIHEGAHLYLNIYDQLATSFDAPKEIAKDFKAILEWFNVTKNQWGSMTLQQKEYYHERFAETFEVYAAEGVAPNDDMSGEFEKFGGWMAEVYGVTANHRPLAKLTPEIKQVFDRMLSNTSKTELSTAIKQSVMSDLVHSGISAERAEVHSTVFSAAYNTLAARSGMDHNDFINRFSLSITSTQTPDPRARDLLRKAKESGYKGETLSDAAEWLNASNSGLDMSEAGRMRRAAEQGFEPAVWFHGSETAGFQAFDLTNSDTSRPDSIFMADTLQVASTYSGSNNTNVLHTPEELFANPELASDLEIYQTLCLIDDEGYVEHEFENYEEYESQVEAGLIDDDHDLITEARFNLYYRGYQDVENGTKDQILHYLRHEFENTEPGIYQLMAKTKDAFVAEIDWQGHNWDDGPKSKAWEVVDEDGDILETVFYEDQIQRAKDAFPDAEIVEIEHQEFETTNEVARVCRDMGVDFVRIKNITDDGPHGYGGEGTILITFDEKNVRSIDAAFDPGHTGDAYLLAQSAFHGSGVKFDEFNLDYVGTGTRATAYGWGLYFTDKIALAKEYKKEQSPPSTIKINGKEIEFDDYEALTDWAMDKDLEEPVNAIAAMKKRFSVSTSVDEYLHDLSVLLDSSSIHLFERVHVALKTERQLANHLIHEHKLEITKADTGVLYEVELSNSDHLLEYETPLFEQPAAILPTIRNISELIGIEFEPPKSQYRAYQDGSSDFYVIDDRSGLTLPVGYGSLEEAQRSADYLQNLRNEANSHLLMSGHSLYDSLATWLIERPEELIKLGMSPNIKPDTSKRHYAYEAASRYLGNHGIPGLKYSHDSISSGDTSQNYVLWDEGSISILQAQQNTSATFKQQAINAQHKNLIEQFNQDDMPAGAKNEMFLYHNLTPENLDFANKILGGNLISPSLALTNQMVENFGSVTLVANPSIADAPQSTIYDCDIASPRLPRPVPVIDRSKLKGLNKLIEGVVGSLNLPELTLESLQHVNAINNITSNPQFCAYVLTEMGIEIKEVTTQADLYTLSLIERGKEIGFDNLLHDKKALEVISKHFDAEIKKHLQNDEFGGLEKAVLEGIYFGADSMPNENLALDYIRSCRSTHDSKGIDTFSITHQISDLSMIPGNRACIRDMAETILSDMTTELTFISSHTDESGEPVFLPYTPDNLNAHMNEVTMAGETLSFGVNKLRAAHAGHYIDTEEARINNSKLANHEELDDLFNDTTSELLALCKSLSPYYKGDSDSMFYIDHAVDALCKPSSKWCEDFNLDDGALQKAKGFIDHISRLPTEYFEVKFNGSLRLYEFSAAIVPTTIDPDSLKTLQKYGIPIIYDNSGKPEARLAAIAMVNAKLAARTPGPCDNSLASVQPGPVSQSTVTYRDPLTRENTTSLGRQIHERCSSNIAGINIHSDSVSHIVAEALKVNISHPSEIININDRCYLKVSIDNNSVLIDSKGLHNTTGSETQNSDLSDTPKDSSMSYKLAIIFKDIEISDNLSEAIKQAASAYCDNSERASKIPESAIDRPSYSPTH